MNRRARMIFGMSLAVVFIAGLLVGAAGMRARIAYRYPLAFHSETEVVDIWIRRLDRRLHLSAEQQAAIRPELGRTIGEAVRARQAALLSLAATAGKLDETIRSTLTDSQRATYTRLVEERRKSAVHPSP